MKNSLSLSAAKEISIVDFLFRIGKEPASTRGNDYWYHSPFREEKTPSFKVDSRRNLWYDHGIGEGGTILDLGIRLHRCTIPEFLEILNNEGMAVNASFGNKVIESDGTRRLEVLKVSRLTNEDLLSYLERRGIEEGIARRHCRQATFKIGTGVYEGIGFLNRSGGMELRNAWFKGSSSPKDVTLISKGGDRIAVFEGFVDFLSFLVLESEPASKAETSIDFLILNSLNLLNRCQAAIRGYKTVDLYLDNDKPGKEATAKFLHEHSKVVDRSSNYSQYKDLNDFLVGKTESNIQKVGRVPKR